MTVDSLPRRYVSKIVANIISLAIGLGTQLIVPRSLGPRGLGDFSFLTDFFQQCVGFLDMGSSLAFFSKLSQRQREGGLVTFYSYFVAAVVVIGFLLTGIVMVSGMGALLWPGQEGRFVFLAAIWGLGSWLVQILIRMADAYGATVQAEMVRILQRLVCLFLLLGLFASGHLNLETFFMWQFLGLALLGLGCLVIIVRGHYLVGLEWWLPRAVVRRYAQEFFEYCHPILVYALVGLIVGLIDRWVLQRLCGSAEQGFYGLSSQVGAVCFLFTGALTPLIMREFAVAFVRNDIADMARLFRRYVPPLYAMAAFLSCFIAVHSTSIVRLLGGPAFASGAWALSIMAFYPVHQTYGQLSGSLFYATGNTALYRNIGLIFSILSLPMTFLFLAPKTWFGLDGGAAGLAAKMVTWQFFTVNAQLYFNARFLGISFWRYFGHQLVVLGVMLLASTLSSLFASAAGYGSAPVNLAASGVAYFLFVGFATVLEPRIFGLKSGDIGAIMAVLRRFGRAQP